MLLKYIEHILFPEHCPVCGRLAVPFCRECLDNVSNSELPPLCSMCGGGFSQLCCKPSVPCYAATAHAGAARELVLSLKYYHNRTLGAAIGERIAGIFPVVNADWIIPVPLHTDSKRDYNQSKLIADGVSHIWGIPVKDDILFWRKHSQHQTGKGLQGRLSLPADSFIIKEHFCNKKAILIDDVYTTGTTARIAISALAGAGINVVSVYTWTRRIPEEYK